MTGKHMKRKKKVLKFIIGILFVSGSIFCYFHFRDDQEIDLSQYETMVGTIEKVGDETLLIRDNDKQDYLISIAGSVDSNKGLKKGNRIYIYYEGKLDVKNKDIQNVKVKSYKVLNE